MEATDRRPGSGSRTAHRGSPQRYDHGAGQVGTIRTGAPLLRSSENAGCLRVIAAQNRSRKQCAIWNGFIARTDGRLILAAV